MPGAWQGKCLSTSFDEALDKIYLVPVNCIKAANKADKCRKLPHKMPLDGLHSVLPVLRWTSFVI